jgi:CheY-like chemotaxis protein
MKWLNFSMKRVRAAMTLPTPQVPPPRFEVQPLAPTGSGKILVVDDNPVILQTLSMKLKSAGYEVITAMDGSEALGAVGREQPDLILLDIAFPPDVPHGGIPHWEGLRLMLWLRSVANAAAIPFIIISGTAPELKDSALAAGAVAFFSKPIDHDRLLIEIEKQLSPRPDVRQTSMVTMVTD